MRKCIYQDYLTIRNNESTLSLIVEGEVGEYNILHDNLVKHGYYVNKFERKFWLNDDLPDFNITEYCKC